MHAVILAGGKGARLRPYTTILPKPLMPIGEMPILEIVLRQLQAAGFPEVTIAVGYLAELLKAVLGDGRRLKLEIRYSLENKPLGTVGPLKIINNLPETFLVMNGDVLTNIDYQALVSFHRRQQSTLTIATHKRQVPVDFGLIELNGSGLISSYTEKPTLNYVVSMGIYILQRDALKYVPDGKHFDLPHLAQTLIERGERVVAYPFDGYWLDIGRPDDYAAAIEEFEQRRQEFLPDG